MTKRRRPRGRRTAVRRNPQASSTHPDSREQARVVPPGQDRARRHRVSWLRAHRAAWWALLAYFVVAMLFTLPAWEHPATRWIGGPSDPMKFMEFLGWYPFAITHGLNPFMNTYVNLPNGSNMMWDTTVPFASVVLSPVTAAFGVIATWNVAVVTSLVLDGWCTFFWLRRHVHHSAVAWLGGLLMVLGPFAATRAHLHLNLLIFFPMPLIFIQVEDVLARRRQSLWAGVWTGALAAMQFLCCEEILALAAVAVGTAVVIAWIVNLPNLRRVVVPLARQLAIAVPSFLLLAGGPLAYQFFGPGRIVGPIQTPDTYVTDVVNLVVPGQYTALAPAFAAKLASRWVGGVLENDAYIGVPLLTISLFVLVRWRRDPWVNVIGWATLAAIVWSFGGYLHFNGAVEHAFPLPWRIFANWPVLDNVLPARFDLFTDFGLAALLSVFVDRTVLSSTWSWKSRGVGVVAVVLACITLAPSAPVGAYSPDIPRYFLARGDVQALPQGTVAFVVPYGDGELTMGPMLWQAISGFRIRMVAGAMYTAGPHGRPSLGRSLWGTGSTTDCVMQLLQSGVSTRPCTADPVAAVRSDLNQLKAKVIIMGPMAYGGAPSPLTAPMESFLSSVAGSQPRHDEGVLIWHY